MRPSESAKKWLGRVTDRYHASLLDNPEALTYLADRGITREMASGSRLGLVSDPDALHEEYRGRLALPYLTPTGVITMRFRCLENHSCSDNGCPKYIQPKGEPTHLYNVQALHDADTEVGICEGELDAIVATEAGYPSVGVPGVQNWKPFYYRLFADFERVVIFGDGDAAGRTFASQLAHNIPNGEAKVMPSGSDVNSYVVEYGSDSLLEYVCSA